MIQVSPAATLSRPIPLKLVAAFVLFAAAVISAIASIAALASLNVNVAILWACLGTTVHLLGLMCLLSLNSAGLGLKELRLGSWMVAYGAFAFGVGTLTILPEQQGTFAVANKSGIPLAMLFIAAGYTAFAIGSGLGRARIARFPLSVGWRAITRPMSENVVSVSALYAVFLLGFLADVATIIFQGSYGYLGNSTNTTVDSAVWYSQPIAIVSALKNIALFGIAYKVFVDRTARFAPALLPPLLFSLAFGILSGTKEAFIATVLSVGVPYVLGRNKIPVIPVAAIVLIFTLVISPIVTSFRQDVAVSGGRLDVASALQLGVERIFTTDGYLADSEEGTDPASVLTRFRLIDSLAVIMQETPAAVAYRPLSEIVAAPLTGLVPRAFWPDKPVRVSGYEFYLTYFGGASKSSSAITLQGSLFMYGGLGVLLLGMLLIGLATRVLDDVLAAKRSVLGALFFTILVPVVVKQEQDVPGFLASIVVFIITWFLGAFLITKRHKQGAGLADEWRGE